MPHGNSGQWQWGLQMIRRCKRKLQTETTPLAPNGVHLSHGVDCGHHKARPFRINLGLVSCFAFCLILARFWLIDCICILRIQETVSVVHLANLLGTGFENIASTELVSVHVRMPMILPELMSFKRMSMGCSSFQDRIILPKHMSCKRMTFSSSEKVIYCFFILKV